MLAGYISSCLQKTTRPETVLRAEARHHPLPATVLGTARKGY